jgi:hypothetical protein
MYRLSRTENRFGESSDLKHDGAVLLKQARVLLLPNFKAIDVHGFGEDPLLGIPGLHHAVIQQLLAAELHSID